MRPDASCPVLCFFFFSSRRRHTRFDCDWSSDVCSSDLGNHFELLGVEKSFQDTSGFVNRTDFVAGRTFNRFSWYGRPGALVEQLSVIVGFAPIWRYRDFGRLNRTIEDTLETFWIANLRGGWQAQVTLNLNHFGFESADYAGYTVGGTPFSDRKSTRLNSSHSQISYAVFCLKKKKISSTPCAGSSIS